MAPHDDSAAWSARWLARLCGVDSTSGREGALVPELRAMLGELGAEVLLQPVEGERCNLLATWGEPRVLFTTHLDTVPPFFPPRLAGGTLHGRGTCDAKGQIAAQLGAVRNLLAGGTGGLGWLGVVGEETTSDGAEAALALAGRLGDVRCVVDGEPTGNRLATGQRGVLSLRLVTEGRAAHSGTPERGRSAIWLLVDWLARLRETELGGDPELGPDVWNVGRIEGGDAANTVPAAAEARVLARLASPERFLEEVRARAPEGASVEVLLDEPADRYPPVDGFERAAVPFGSDAPRLRALARGRNVVLVGPGSIDVAHGPDECLELSELARGIEIDERLGRRFAREEAT